MPQVFGADQLSLISEASVFTESAVLTGDPRESDHFGQFTEQHGFKRETPVNPQQIASAAGRMVYSRDLGMRTIGDKPPRRDASTGQLLNGNGWHELVVHVNNNVREGSPVSLDPREPKRYTMVHQHVDGKGNLHERAIGPGFNTVHAMNSHPEVRAVVGRLTGR